jgi:ribonuclease HI
MKLDIYCDGSCLGNGKENSCGGWGVVVVVGDAVLKTYNKGYTNTTNNRMELEGMLFAIKAAKLLDQEAEIFCDSAYVVNTVNQWMHNWANKGWIKSDKKPPENLDLVKQIYNEMAFTKNITITKVKGHANNQFNNLADGLAVQASNEIKAKELIKGLNMINEL